MFQQSSCEEIVLSRYGRVAKEQIAWIETKQQDDSNTTSEVAQRVVRACME